MTDSSNLIMVLIVLVGVIAVFLVCREAVCWYWKINKRLAMLERLVDQQSTLASLQASTNDKLDAVCQELRQMRKQNESGFQPPGSR